jgi:hypothetical protein
MSAEMTHDDLIGSLDYNAATGVFCWKKSIGTRNRVGDVAGYVEKRGYIQIKVGGKLHRAHRLAWFYVHGKWPEFQIDHIDGDKTNNAIANLRDVEPMRNSENVRKARISNKTSGLLGVTFHKPAKKWLAQIGAKGKHKYLGLFLDPLEAHQAYLTAKRELHEGCTI